MRTRLIHGARAVVQRAERRTDTQGRWRCALKHRTGTTVAAVALANKHARVIWALLAHDEAYRPPASVPAGAQRFLGGDEPRAASHKEDSHQGVQRGRSVMTPEGHPARSDPGQTVGPNKAVVLMRRTRAYFIKARTHVLSTKRPDI